MDRINPDRELYRIRYERLKDKEGGSGGTLSWLILHLSRKKWITSDILYSLAAITQKRFPDSGINWEGTFSIYERGVYLDQAFELMNTAETEKRDDDFMKRIEFAWKENSVEMSNEIDERIQDKLRQYGVI